MGGSGSATAADGPVDASPIAAGDGPWGVLLLHGLTGTPHDVRGFADALVDAGFAVRAPLLAGHIGLAELEATTWGAWYNSAQAAFDSLHNGGARRVIVLGFSMGALLALRLCALRSDDVEGLIAISVPLHLPPLQRRAVAALAKLRGSTVLGALVGVLPKFRGPDLRVRSAAMRSPSLRGFPYPTLLELTRLQDEVATLVARVTAPTLLLHGRYDHTTPVRQSEELAEKLGSHSVRLRVLPRSFHVIGLDLDRELARSEITKFAQRLAAQTATLAYESP